MRMQSQILDPGILLTLDSGSGMEKSDQGSGINIPDPQHCLLRLYYYDCMEVDGHFTCSAKFEGLISREK